MTMPVRRPPVWALATVAGVLSLGSLPAAAALSDLQRLAPVLGFLLAATALAGLAEVAGVFDVAADRCAVVSRGRTPVLFALVVVLAVSTTVFLSLDTTAVLLTPVVLTLARRLQLPPLPFAFATVWLANTGSLLLPVSNLSNLLAQHRVGLPLGRWVQMMAAPAAVAVLVTVAVLVALHARDLRGRYQLPERAVVADPLMFGTSLAAVLGFLAGVVAGLPVWAVATASAAVAALVALRRCPAVLRPGLVPWRLVPLVTGLLLTADAAGRWGLDALAARVVGGASTLGVAVSGAVLANAIDNLPAYLALERVVPSHAVPALLVGVNCGPLVTPWASLATLLWADRCRAAGLVVPWRSFVLRGLMLTPIVLLATTAATAWR